MAEPTSTIVQYLQHLVGVMRADPRTDAELLSRFITSRDEESFRVLIGRYAALVWGNCRRILGATPDAEDAFQATFLALACKAATVRAETLANWLYRISERIARNSRKALLRRLRHETHAASSSPESSVLTSADEDRVIWEEMENLPERLRMPLVLYYLNGKTQAEAGRVLGITDRAVSQRLEQALTKLRNRLASRGFAITVAALATLLGQAAATAAIVPPLPEDFLQRVATATAEGHVSPSVANLVARALTPRAGIWIAVALIVGGVCGAAMLLLLGSKNPPPAELPAVRTASTQPHQFDPILPNLATPAPWATLKGSVTDEAGRPVPQAKLTVLAQTWNQGGAGRRDEAIGDGTSDANGRFQLSVVRTVPGEVNNVWLAVTAPGAHTVIDVPVAGGVTPKSIAIRLTPRPITGRVVDPMGRVLSGAMVRVVRFGGAAFEPTRREHELLPAEVWPAPVTTGPDGRFTLPGLDESANLKLTILHPENGTASVLDLPRRAARKDIEVRMPPTRRFAGRVLAADTGQPLPNAQVVVDFQTVAGAPPLVRNTRTDSNGMFSLALPQAPRWIVEVMLVPRPYLGVRRIVELPEGDGDVVTDIRVEKGVVVRGRVTDAGTDRPIHFAKIRFFPHVGEQTESEAIESVLPHSGTNAEGDFVLAIPSTGGVLVATAPSPDYALVDVDQAETRGRFYAAHAAVTLAPGEPPETAFRLERGRTIQGRALLPDGSPVPGGWVWCSRFVGGRDLQTPYALTIEDGRFAIPGCRPNRTYSVVLADRTLRYGTVAKIACAKEPTIVTLQSTGSASIDVRNSSDRPIAGSVLSVELGLPEDAAPGEASAETHWFPLALGGPVGPDGQRLLPGLVPGARYRIGVPRGLGFGRAETIKTVSPGGHEQATLVLPDTVKK